MKRKLALLFLSVVCTTNANAELMTVQNLRDMLQNGDAGELVATSYVQGVVEGMLGMESVHHKEKKLPYEFCKLHDAYSKGMPEKHPAYQTKKLVAAWEKQGYPMNTPAIDMILSYMTAEFGCKK